MAISPELMLAILAMDSYNRGYNSGIGTGPNGLGITGQIGNAIIDQVRGDQTAVAASFFGISYTYNGQTVISYRGTDVLPFSVPEFLTADNWKDVIGWNYGDMISFA